MRWLSVRWLLCVLVFSSAGVSASAQPAIGLKLELLSIRNRQSAPVPVRVRIEYNQPQYLEGTLELHIHDAQDFLTEDDRLATIRRDGIVLAGRDYEFNLLLPPLRPSTQQNYAVRAWFVTKDDRIALTSIAGRLNPPEPFDLLMLPENQRGLIVCSVCERPDEGDGPGPDRRLLERVLTMEEWDPGVSSGGPGGVGNGDSSGSNSPGSSSSTLVHHSAVWSARDIPEDPLWLCAFDVLLFSERGLAALNREQLAAVSTWVRAGGSICVHAPENLEVQHFQFLRDLAGDSRSAAAALSLDPGGRLLFPADNPGEPIFAEAGLGRLVVLPSAVPLQEVLGGYPAQSQLLRFVWRIRSDFSMQDPLSFQRAMELERIRGAFLPGAELTRDEIGYRVEGNLQYRNRQHWQGFSAEPTATTAVNGQRYLPEGEIRGLLTMNPLRARTEAAAEHTELLLLPQSLRLVPTSVMMLILFSYVLVIGPIDYFVLGWLRARKYTWIVFPVVTLAFTLLTMAVARIYMGGQNSQRTMTITDLGSGNSLLRQTTLSTLFYSSQDTVRIAQRNQFCVQMDDEPVDPNAMNFNTNVRPSDNPPEYESVFPAAWEFVQPVRQWSPVTLRTLTFSPDPAKTLVPRISWDDEALITGADGRQRLSGQLVEEQQRTGVRHAAYVLQQGRILWTFGMSENTSAYWDYAEQNGFGYMQPAAVAEQPEAVFQRLPTQRPAQVVQLPARGFFSIFTAISPQGSATLEDLVISDSSDPSEYVLVLVRISGMDIEVFRRKYRLE
jgi:hypothetical protein